MITSNATYPLRVPGPPPRPLLGRYGNLLQFGNDPIHYMGHLFQRYGPVVALVAGGGTRMLSPFPRCPGAVFAFGPDLVQQVETQHEIYHKSALTGSLYPLGDTSDRKAPLTRLLAGLFQINGDVHRTHRRLLLPAFHKRRVESYCSDMVAITQGVLDKVVAGNQYDVANLMRQITIHIVTKTLFGEDVSERNIGIGRALHRWVGMTFWARAFPFDISPLPYHRWLNLAHAIDNDIRAVITEKRSHAVDTGDVLALLIQAHDDEGAHLTEDDLIAHTSVIFGAGHETSANALTWTLFLLSQHPAIAADLLDELEAVLGGSAPTVDQLSRLPLLERVIKESLRILPPAALNHRIATHPTELGGHPIPAGAEVVLSIYHTHHMADLYPEPEQFNPDRWRSIEPTVFAYNAFGAGPRMCIGSAFAMMEIKIVLAMLLQRYRTELVRGAKVERHAGITMSAKHGMPMILYPQDRQFHHGVGNVHGNIREMVNLSA